MCLAIPMRVVEIKKSENDFAINGWAVVDAGGIQKEVRLDLVDHPPNVGDYLIIHAGFAINTLAEEEALENLRLMRELASEMRSSEGTEQ